MTAPIDYNAVLADLEGKIAQMTAAAAVIRSLIGAGATEIPTGSASVASGEEGPPVVTATRTNIALDDAHAFFRLSTSAAIKKLLTMTKRPQTVRLIADALRAGGQVHAIDDKTAYTNVYTALKRGMDTDFFQTRNKEWGLKEWHGNKSKGDAE